ncbi:reverse transcriptase domain-containing protein [Tanacetum coccineum]
MEYETMLENTNLRSAWKLYTDGASSSDGSGAGIMLINPKGKEYTYAQCFEFKTTNNEAEYKALLAGLQIAHYTIEHIWRNQNKKADAISKLASMTFEHLTKEVLVEVLAKRSIDDREVLQVKVKEGESWMTPIHEYLLSGLLPEDLRESRKIIIKAPQNKLIKGNLYKKSFFRLWLRYLAPPQANNIIKEIHEGSCGFNTEPHSMEQSMAKKAARKDAIAVKSIWPFNHWGVSILGPLPTSLGSFKFLGIAVEHSTKWVEAKPLTTINGKQAEKFAWEYKICRTFSRNSQTETPFSLTYGSEAIISTVESFVPKDNKHSTKENVKRKERKEVVSIEEAYY